MTGYLYWSDVEPKFAAISERLGAIEEHLAKLSQILNVPYTPPSSGIPESVAALVREGKTMDAIKEYRALTGAGLEEARAAINKA